MKKMMMTILLAGVLAGFSFAADSTASLDTAKLACAIDNYRLALKSDNPGVRSSALYMLALIKSRYPEMNNAEVMSELGKVSRKDEDPLVRIQANLVLSYINSNTLMTKIKVDNPETPVAFYSQLITAMTASRDEIR